MKTTVSGAGSGNQMPAMQGALSIKNSGLIVPQTMFSGSKKPTVKKQLNYNHREISGQLIRAKKVQSASGVLTRAKSRLASLQRCVGSEQYDRRELANAIAHARSMVRCAQLKVRNLREEEQEQKRNKSESGAEKQQKKNEMERRIAQKERELEQKANLEMMEQARREKSRRQQLVQKRKNHRSEELGKISEADMKYIKGLTERSRDDAGEYQPYDTGVVLQLSQSASELAMMEEEIRTQAEQEIQAEIAALESMAGITGADMAAPATPDSPQAPASECAVSVSVDVSV